MITVEITENPPASHLDRGTLRQAVVLVLREEGIQEALISLVVVDDATIQPLNRQYLRHDYATDVLSFLLEEEGARIEGEIIISAETASRQAAQYQWSPADELLLYAIHGTLHLVGFDDRNERDRQTMRKKEKEYLSRMGVGMDDRPCKGGPESR